MDKGKVRRLLVLGDGASIHTERWLQGLALDSSWELYLISSNPAPIRSGIAEIPGVKEVIHLAPTRINPGGGNFQYLFLLPSIRREIQRIKPDVINSMYLTSYGLIAALLKGGHRLCHYVMGSDIIITPGKNFFYEQVTRFALARASLIISASQQMTDKLVEMKTPSSRILTQQYGVEDWLIETPFAPKVFDFVSNRTWVPNSNLMLMFEALRNIESSYQAAIIGEPVKGFEKYAADIKEHIKLDLRLNLIGPLPFRKNISVVSQAKYLLSFTLTDGTSLSLLEAMAVGTVPIVSDIAPNREWVRDGENGFVVPMDDAKKALAQLQKALALPIDQYKRMQEANRQIIRDRGSLRANMAKVSERMKVDSL